MSRVELVGSRVLVVGLARSGVAAAEALLAAGAQVVGFDRNEALDTGRLRELRCRNSPRTRGGDAATGDRSRREEPGGPGRDAAGPGRARACRPRLERDRARRAAPPEPDPRRHGDERQDDDDASFSARFPGGGPPVEVAGNVGRPLTSLVGDASAGGLGRVRAVVVPARGRRDAAAARRRPPQPRAGPPRPARHIRRVRRHEAPDLRAPGGGRHRGRPSGVRLDPRRRTPGRLRGDRRASRRAAHPRAAQPRERRGGDGGAHARRGSTTPRSREALRTFEGVPHRIELVRELRGVRYVNDSKATNVAAALRALASFPDSRLHVILGGRGKHEPYDGSLAAAFKPGDSAPT